MIFFNQLLHQTTAGRAERHAIIERIDIILVNAQGSRGIFHVIVYEKRGDLKW